MATKKTAKKNAAKKAAGKKTTAKKKTTKKKKSRSATGKKVAPATTAKKAAKKAASRKTAAKQANRKRPSKKKPSTAATTTAGASRRPFDVIIFGATGFTGALVADYIARSGEVKPGRLALAGRSIRKLESVQQRIGRINPDYGKVGLIEADINRPDSLKSMVQRARAVATTVGPYIFYGEPLLKACAEAGTHYADLTGEPEFVDRMIYGYQQVAERSGARIVNCCGFDSIPHDAGAWFTAAELAKRLPAGGPAPSMEIRGYVNSKGTFSGGTLHSAIHAFSRGRTYLNWKKDHPLPKSALPETTVVRPASSAIHRVGELGGWGIPLPTIDPAIVRRTARTSTVFGRRFEYGHYALTRKLATGLVGIAGVGTLAVAAQVPPVRDQILKLKSPGEGPDEATRARSRFQVEFVGRCGDARIVTRVSGGDPGYGETAKMLAEITTALALDTNLPAAAGVLTPMQAAGPGLIERLDRQGIRFEVVR